MAYERRILHYDTDSTTLLSTLSVASGSGSVISAWFELLRQGGCGAGEIVLNTSFIDRGSIEINQYIAMDYESGDRWYFGRIESITEESPSNVRVSLFGLWAEVNEVFPGGFGSGTEIAPHRYAKAALQSQFGNDPDFSIQSFEAASQPEQIAVKLFNTYIGPATNAIAGSVESPSPQVGIESIVFRGEETAAAIVKQLATHMKTASYGIDENKKFFIAQKRSGTLATFQEGVDLEGLERMTDRSLLFNRILLTGGYIYGGTGPGFYRYRASFRQSGSVSTYGEKRARIFLPWVRRNSDAIQFAKEFFRDYSLPTTRYAFKTSGQSTLYKPWSGTIQVRDRDGTALATLPFDKIRVEFNHVPLFTITLGSEDIQFPTAVEDQRFETPSDVAGNRGDGEAAPEFAVDSLASYAGTSADYS